VLVLGLFLHAARLRAASTASAARWRRFVLRKSAAAAEKHALAYNHILNKQLQQSG
jgi:hypothetical protein